MTEAIGRKFEDGELAALLPFRRPWLLVDNVVDWAPSEFIKVRKCFSPSDPLIMSHLSSAPLVVPGVLLIELIGQAGFLLARLSNRDEPVHVLARCRAHFQQPAYAEDILDVTVKVKSIVRGASVCVGQIERGVEKICEVESIGAPLSKGL